VLILVGSVPTTINAGGPPIWDNSEFSGRVLVRRLMLDIVLIDDIDLCGGFLVWLTKTRRDWLTGRYLMSNYDVDELERMKDQIVKADKLKFKMAVEDI